MSRLGHIARSGYSRIGFGPDLLKFEINVHVHITNYYMYMLFASDSEREREKVYPLPLFLPNCVDLNLFRLGLNSTLRLDKCCHVVTVHYYLFGQLQTVYRNMAGL